MFSGLFDSSDTNSYSCGKPWRQQVLPWRRIWVAHLCIYHNSPFSHLYTLLYICLGSWILPDSDGPLPEGKYNGGRLTESTPFLLLQLISRPQLWLSFSPTTPFRFLVCSAPPLLDLVAYQVTSPRLSSRRHPISWSKCSSRTCIAESIYTHSWAREYHKVLRWLGWVLHVLLLAPVV